MKEGKIKGLVTTQEERQDRLGDSQIDQGKRKKVIFREMYETRGIEVRKKYKVELRWKIAKIQEKRERIIKDNKGDENDAKEGV